MSSIIKKLYIGFALILTLLCGMGIFTVWIENSLSKNINELLEYDVGMSQLSSGAYAKMLEARMLERNMALYVNNPDKLKEEKQLWNNLISDNKNVIKNMLAITEKSGEKEVAENISNFEKQLFKYEKTVNATYELIDAEIISDSMSVLKNLDEAKQVSETVVKTIQDIYKNENSHIEQDKVDLAKETENIKNISTISSLIIIVLFLLIGANLAKSIKDPLVDFKNKARDIIRNNDLTINFTEGKNEFGEIAKDINTVINSLRKSISLVVDASKSTLDKSQQVSKNAEEISASINVQADSTTESASAIEELTVSINQVSELSKSIKDNMKNVTGLSKVGMDLSDDTKKIIQQIEVDFTELSGLLNNLEVTSNNISSIVSTIRDIAEQTNLLALNAAIEAARAGETGRGFAVVADEVRKLSEKTAKATQEIAEMITSVQSQSKDVSEVIGKTNQKVVVGVGKVESTNNKINEMGQLVHDAEIQITEISASIQEQYLAATEIAKTVENIAMMSERNSAAATETFNISKDLKKSASDVVSDVSKFKA